MCCHWQGLKEVSAVVCPRHLVVEVVVMLTLNEGGIEKYEIMITIPSMLTTT